MSTVRHVNGTTYEIVAEALVLSLEFIRHTTAKEPRDEYRVDVAIRCETPTASLHLGDCGPSEREVLRKLVAKFEAQRKTGTPWPLVSWAQVFDELLMLGAIGVMRERT